MKKIFLIFSLVASCFLIEAQDLSMYAKITNTLFIGKYEVSNGDYKNFLNNLIKTGKEELYKSCLPDTMLWKKDKDNTPYSIYYFSYPAFQKYPLVGISYENALRYCEWLTDVYNSSAKREFKKVLFRLPTDEEWTFAANGGDKTKTYTWNSPFILDSKKGYLCNFLVIDNSRVSYDNSSNALKVVEVNQRNFPPDRTTIPGPVKYFSPNQFGIYNMCGNVAEMVSEKGIAKGGSYNDPGYDVRIASVKHYNQPSIEIGFRVAMEVLEK